MEDLKEEFDNINEDNCIINICQKTQLLMQENYQFGYQTMDEIIKDLKDELDEMYKEIEKGDIEKIELEIGDVVFVLCNLSNKYKINLGEALKKSTTEYQKRLEYIQNKIGYNKMDKEKINQLWKEAKNRNIV